MVLENTLWLNIKRQTVYRVLFVCKHSETLEDLVCYQDVDNPEKRWVRPYNLFIEKFKPIDKPESEVANESLWINNYYKYTIKILTSCIDVERKIPLMVYKLNYAMSDTYAISYKRFGDEFKRAL